MTAFSIPEKIINKLSQNGYDAYFVGGCVRDFLRGEAFTDIDICTSATPEEVKKCFSEETIIETGIKHGTVTLLFCGESFEITTFRSEQGYNDSRHPSNVEFIKSINEDLSRRDFTMNAIALKDGIITDPFGGSQDIKNKIIRTVGNPDERFKEDALRILRALRFSSVLGFEIEEKTAESIFKNKELLCHVSKERIAVEFNKILLGKNVENILINYSSVIAVFIPEILQTINFNQHNPFHIYDVYTHIVKAVASSENNIYIRLTMFFHDMAKPQCFSLDNDGIGHFKKHADKSSDMAKIVLNRMKYDNKTIDTVCFLVKNHYTKLLCEKSFIKMFMKTCGAENFKRLLAVMRADNIAKNGAARDRLMHIDNLENLFNIIIKNNECFLLKDLAVNGSDLLVLGFSGKNIGDLLDIILNKVITGEIENDRNKILSSSLLKELTQNNP